jgi:glycosyltransferase involved in cell wall biosynthesis
MITRDAERHLEAVLRALAWCDEIVVVDAESTDATPAICERLAAEGLPVRLLTRAWTDYGEQRGFSVEQARHDWVLVVDADEIVTDELRESILAALAEPGDAAGFELERTDYFMDRPMDFGGLIPDLKIRLFHRGRGRITATAAHEAVVVEGPVRRLAGRLEHLSNLDLRTRIDKLNRYSGLIAEQAARDGARVGRRQLYLDPARYAFYLLVKRRAHRSGRETLIYAATLVIESFLTAAKTWEAGRGLRASSGRPPAHLDDVNRGGDGASL